jgi:hypothetical protein
MVAGHYFEIPIVVITRLVRNCALERVIQYSVSKFISGLLDPPAEPVIGLAEGETRWRGMNCLIKNPKHS